MAFMNRTSNAFAVLQEEHQVFRKKEKKERALHRRAMRNAEKIESVVTTGASPIFPRNTPATESLLSAPNMAVNVKWSDVLDDDDDDDDDDEYQTHRRDTPESVCSEASYSEEEEDDDDEEDEDSSAKLIEATLKSAADLKDTTAILGGVKDVDRVPAPPKSSGNRPLSRKEREVLEQKAKEDFDALLNDMGLVPVAEEPQQPETAVKETAPPAEATEGATNSKNKKKKKKKEAAGARNTTIDSTEAPVQDAPAAAITPEQALAAAKKAAAAAASSKKGGKSSFAASGADTVLAEAKRRAELKKSKQKKDKHMFDH